MICKRCQMNTVECAGSILAPTSIQCTACGWKPGDDPLKMDAAPQVVAAATDFTAKPIQYAAVAAGDMLSNQAGSISQVKYFKKLVEYATAMNRIYQATGGSG